MAGGFGDLDAGLLTEAELGGPLVDELDAHPTARLVEETVAGHVDGVRDVVRAVGGVVGAVECVVGVVGVGTGTVPLELVVDDALFERRDGGAGLERGTGLIGTHDGAVPEGSRFVLGPFGVLLFPLVVVVGGVRGAGEDLAGVDIFHDDRRGTLPGSRDVQGVHALFQGFLGDLLQVFVQRQDDGVALFRQCREGALRIAVLVDGDRLRAPFAPELVLHGELDAGASVDVGNGVGIAVEFIDLLLAAGLVEGLFQFLLLLLVLLGGDAGDAAEDVGREHTVVIDAVVLGGIFHTTVEVLVLHDDGDEVGGNVLREGVGVGRVEGVAEHLDLDRGEAPGVLLRVGTEVVPLDERVHAVLRGGVLIEVQDVFGLEPLEIGGVLVLVLEDILPGLLRDLDGQVVDVFDAVRVTELDERDDDLVALLLFLRERRGVEGDIVAEAAGDEHGAVAVEDVAAGGIDRGRVGAEGAGVGTGDEGGPDEHADERQRREYDDDVVDDAAGPGNTHRVPSLSLEF